MTPNCDEKCDNPICAKCNLLIADVAQPEEQLACTEQVAGSTPAVGCAKCISLETEKELLERFTEELLKTIKEIGMRK